MSTVSLNIIGLVLNFTGVIVLFRYGMPFEVRTRGANQLVVSGYNSTRKALEDRWDRYGYLGMIAIAAGTVLQIIAAYRAG